MVIYGFLMISNSVPLVVNTRFVIYGLLKGEGYAKLVEITPMII